MQRFGAKLRTLRTRRGMTLRELAQALGYVSHSYINLVEIGKKKPTAELVTKVGHYFNASMDRLLRDDLDLDE